MKKIVNRIILEVPEEEVEEIIEEELKEQDNTGSSIWEVIKGYLEGKGIFFDNIKED